MKSKFNALSAPWRALGIATVLAFASAFSVFSQDGFRELFSFLPPPSHPDAALAQGSDGNFYGTTQFGGANNGGTVFRITPEGTLTTLVSFDGSNGSRPYATLALGSDGYFYGTTRDGGANSVGTVFKLTSGGTLTTLVSFDGSNGSSPLAALAQGSDGDFYGTTSQEGTRGGGNIYRLTILGLEIPTIDADKSAVVPLINLTGRGAVMDVSSDLVHWAPVSTNTTSARFHDSAATSLPARFYRARLP